MDAKKYTGFRVLIKAFLVRKKGTKTAVLSRVAKGVAKFRSVAPHASDVCAENFSHSARLLYACLVPSGNRVLNDTWVWTRVHALAIMHRRTLCENVDSAKLKVPFYTIDTDIYAWHRRIVSSYIVSIYWSISMNRYTRIVNKYSLNVHNTFFKKRLKHLADPQTFAW